MDGGGKSNSSGEEGSLGVALKKYVGEDAQGRLDDPDLRTRVIANEIDRKALKQTIQRIAQEAKGNAGPSAATSVMKNAFMRISQEKAEIQIEAMGQQGLGWEGEGYTDDELQTVRAWLGGKAGSIYGGSSEVQNNIIAKRILGLPDLTQKK